MSEKTQLTQVFPADTAIEKANTLLAITKAFQDWKDTDRGNAELVCLKAQMPLQFEAWQPGDLFVGRTRFPLAGFYPQIYTKRSGFGFFGNTEAIIELSHDPSLPAEMPEQLVETASFWEEHDSVNLSRARFPEDVVQLLPGDDWIGKPGAAFPLYRMAGTQLNYHYLLQKGIPGIETDLKEKLKQPGLTDKQTNFLTHLSGIPGLLRHLINLYLHHLDQVTAEDDERLDAVNRIRQSLNNLLTGNPKSLHEAMQLMFLYNGLSGSQNYGRMDGYFSSFYQKDIESGAVTTTDAQNQFCSLWRLMEARGTVYDGRVILGGWPEQNDYKDEVALCCMEASTREKTVLPQLTLRLNDNTNPKVWQKALDTIRSTGIYPMLYNDDVNIPSVMKAFNLPAQEAADYVPFGCGEYTIDGRTMNTPNGVINLPAVLLETLRENAGAEEFSILLKAYKTKTEAYIKALAQAQKITYDAAAANGEFLLFSLLLDDCIRNTAPLFEGGVRYLGGTLETYGNVNTADSLTAIEKTVFQDKQFTIHELVQALENNFEGAEAMRKTLLAQPKYGNNNPVADAMMVNIHEHVCGATQQQAKAAGLHHYLVVVINNDANTDLGKNTGATPDGRLAGEGLNNANSPTAGSDNNGITSLLHSLVKPRTDIHAGAVQNIKLSPEWLDRHRPKFEGLMQGYFMQGGAQAMITMTDQRVLEDAMQHPENYPNLLVRVGGFSARFVELRPEVQKEILHRTAYGT